MRADLGREARRSPSRSGGSRCRAKRRNQKFEICVRIFPLSGMPGERTTSNAEMRSVATKRQRVAEVVDVAHFSAAGEREEEGSFRDSAAHGLRKSILTRREVGASEDLRSGRTCRSFRANSAALTTLASSQPRRGFADSACEIRVDLAAERRVGRAIPILKRTLASRAASDPGTSDRRRDRRSSMSTGTTDCRLRRIVDEELDRAAVDFRRQRRLAVSEPGDVQRAPCLIVLPSAS